MSAQDDTKYEEAARQLDVMLKGLPLSDAVSLLANTLANIYVSKLRSKEAFMRDCGNTFDHFAASRIAEIKAGGKGKKH